MECLSIMSPALSNHKIHLFESITSSFKIAWMGQPISYSYLVSRLAKMFVLTSLQKNLNQLFGQPNISSLISTTWVFPGVSDGKESACSVGDPPGFDPWVGKIPWRREWQPILVFLPGKFHEQQSLAGYSP